MWAKVTEAQDFFRVHILTFCYGEITKQRLSSSTYTKELLVKVSGKLLPLISDNSKSYKTFEIMARITNSVAKWTRKYKFFKMWIKIQNLQLLEIKIKQGECWKLLTGWSTSGKRNKVQIRIRLSCPSVLVYMIWTSQGHLVEWNWNYILWKQTVSIQFS